MLRGMIASWAMIVVALLSVVGCKNGSGNPGIEGVSQYDFRFVSGNIRFSIVFSNLKMDAGAVIPLARPRGATIELGPDFTSGGTLFVVSAPIASLINADTNGLPLLALPDGRAIPDVVAGSLTGAAVTLPLFGLSYIYIGKDVFGLFLPINLPKTNFIVRVRMHDEANNTLGLFYAIPKSKAREISGVLALLPVEGGSAAQRMEEVLN